MPLYDKEILEELCDRREQLGNLAPIPLKTNIKIRNWTFSDKVDELNTKGVPAMKILDWMGESDWGPSLIAARTAKLSEALKARYKLR